MGNSDILFVFAAGNESPNAQIPSRDADLKTPVRHFYDLIHCPNVLHVASIKPDKKISDFSVYGKNTVEVAAPGDKMKLPFANGEIKESMGTSFSTPYVAHMAAEILYQHPNATIEEVVKILKQSVVQTSELKDKLIWGGYLEEKSLKRQATK